MVAREQFHVELKKVTGLIIELAEETERALQQAVHALYASDIELAHKIIEDDVDVDRKEMEINEEAILLIAKQQPVATDLRRLIVALRISSDLERMGDNAKNIAKATIHLGEDHGLTVHPVIEDMKEIALKMSDVAKKAFENEDITMAKKLAELDDKVDNMYGEVVREMLEETATNPQKIQHIMQMAFSARYIERFADHITNIGEDILYLVKGKSIDLNQ
ncbi:phosphate signaling complex protein PhoU [Aquibacillus sp. 3ASR75-11]|uniref:Phosphate-specific transport system accessory protein PhoU n=1 Tax=Terrihalobacillus insolitus TaxID=2950438 RepID=A0A9X3WSE3_9BACI|nr:phosphate signaling complex protein PhoU [Terrihalobacillus insolitus]MDC3413384.1 phosphate signaling complex protein PhoU [Terrihalobacillus insolitus]MDC3424967.1 phosphate signaling complex protein PhoU [Terrihalobacillus insolitus]